VNRKAEKMDQDLAKEMRFREMKNIIANQELEGIQAPEEIKKILFRYAEGKLSQEETLVCLKEYKASVAGL